VPHKIVIVEDNPADVKIVQMALRRCEHDLEMIVLEDGARAIDYFSAEGDVPVCDLILLDLNLPRVSGFEVLEFLKTSPRLKKTPVVVLSGSSSQQDITRAYELGANSYISKPAHVEEVFNMGRQLIAYWFDLAQVPQGPRHVAH
jgi:two-component system, chemotaxis family, response regulator Rcp1